MTEELLLLYKELYKNGGVVYRVGKDKRLTIVFRETTKTIFTTSVSRIWIFESIRDEITQKT